MKNTIRMTAVLLASVYALTAAQAQEYPTQPITVIVPYAPGITDTIVRALAPSMSKELGQPVVIETRGGAGGAVGINAVKQSDPDGYTLLFVNQSTMVVTPMVRDVGYTPDDFIPISTVSGTPLALAGRTDAPYSSAVELVEYADAHPGEVRLGHSGLGGASHLDAEMFEYLTDAELTLIPYQGVAPAITGMLQGEVDLVFAYPAPLLAHVENGDFQYLGIADGERYEYLPELATFEEQGIKLYDNLKTAFFAPEGTDQAVIDELEAAIAVAMDSDEFNNYLTNSKSGRAYLDAEGTAEDITTYGNYWNDFFANNAELVELLSGQ